MMKSKFVLLILIVGMSSLSAQTVQKNQVPPLLRAPKTYKQNTTTVDDKKSKEVMANMPQYPGGDEALMAYLSTNLRYPADAQQKNIQGTVAIKFLIDSDGKVDSAMVLRSVYPSLDQEALRVVNTLPRWTPANQNGEKIKVWYTLPIQFRLQEDPLPVRAGDVVVLDGQRLPTGFDLHTLDKKNLDYKVVHADTEEKKAELVAKYGKDAEKGVLMMTTKTKKTLNSPISKDSVSKKDMNKPDEIVFESVEKMPKFPGGEQGVMNYLQRNTRYPADAAENGEQGVALIRFVVNSEGLVDRAEVIKSSKSRSLDKEALRVVRSMPLWTPGEQKGQKVSVWYTLPVKFRLEQETKKASWE